MSDLTPSAQRLLADFRDNAEDARNEQGSLAAAFYDGERWVREALPAVVSEARREGAEQVLDVERLARALVSQHYEPGTGTTWDSLPESSHEFLRDMAAQLRAALLSEPVPPTEAQSVPCLKPIGKAWVPCQMPRGHAPPCGPVPPEPETPQKETR